MKFKKIQLLVCLATYTESIPRAIRKYMNVPFGVLIGWNCAPKPTSVLRRYRVVKNTDAKRLTKTRLKVSRTLTWLTEGFGNGGFEVKWLISAWNMALAQ
jgi:hypothetical protein